MDGGQSQASTLRYAELAQPKLLQTLPKRVYPEAQHSTKIGLIRPGVIFGAGAESSLSLRCNNSG